MNLALRFRKMEMNVAFINQSDGARKMSSLVDALTAVDHRRLYYLSIATCYCSPNALRAFIDAILGRLKIAHIYLYLDRRNAIDIGHAELNALKRAYPGLLCIYAVRAARLFHTKGYCLAAYDDDDLVEGRLAIGSANLTNPGLINTDGNIESVVIHTNDHLIADFLDFFERDNLLIDLDELTKFAPDDSTDDLVDFQYALLTSGVFSHKWSATLSKYFSVRYQLNEEGRRAARTQADLRGFEAEAVTIAKTYFSFDVSSWRPVDDRLTRKFGIECFLGRWVPKSAFRGNEKAEERLKKFKRALFDELDARMSALQREILADYEAFIEDGIVDELDTEPTRKFDEGIEAMRTGDDLLYRVLSGRYFFELPYDIGDAEGIAETFEDILLTINLRKKRNKTMKAVIKAVETRDLAPLEALSDADL